MESNDSATESAATQTGGVQEVSHSSQAIMETLESVKKQVLSDRYSYIKEKMEENKLKLTAMTQHIHNLAKVRRCKSANNTDLDGDMLTRKQADALCTVNSLEIAGEKESSSFQEESLYASSTVFAGSNFGVKNGIHPIKLLELQKIPPYTTWVFLDKNQRMTEDQSVLGRRRIYYDQTCGEALICSDSEDDAVEDEEEKKEFGSAEDYIIRMTIQQAGLSDAVLDSLAKNLEKNSIDIKARFENFLKSDAQEGVATVGDTEGNIKSGDSLLEKDLEASLDSFDNLFCRRCLVFDCRLHGCSQDLVFPAEKQLPWFSSDDGVPCGIHCYKLGLKPESFTTEESEMPRESEDQTCSSGGEISARKKMPSSVGRKVRSHQSEGTSSNARVVESSGSDSCTNQESTSKSSPPKNKVGGKTGLKKKSSKRIAEHILVCTGKKQKDMAQLDSEFNANASASVQEVNLRSHVRSDNKNSGSVATSKISNPTCSRKSGRKGLLKECNGYLSDEIDNENKIEMIKDPVVSDEKKILRKDENGTKDSCKTETSGQSWKTLEHSLFVKGLEIFGRNSCLIARNLLNGMKTCLEVFQYISYIQDNGSYGADNVVTSLIEGHGNFHSKGALGNQLRVRARFVRRRGRVRRLKYTWKSAGYPSIRKRISERKDQPCRQYNPCGCQTACGKQCPCFLNGTCCEKYCGCPKMCKNRFRGCHCAKSQCRSRQCPCFAADRECDPDVCRNCWVGCGDGTLGGPNRRGDNYECRNMKLLLRQQQRVLLGRSDVSGWGAFLKNTVSKHEYLGEYSGELISHREADKRGKIYDRENSSFLFNLNDQFVLDAYRKGDKLKFANHSPDPNCYAKVIMVAGDHRVGIFAKERIAAGEELFYDYRYEPDRAPVWARKPDATGSKKDEHPSIGRPKKLA